MNEEIEQCIAQNMTELKALIKTLCAIPAPSHREERRADFCKQWLEQAGFQSVTIDDALNVLCPWNVKEDGKLLAVMAHTDTVFPDLEPMPFREENGRYYCPGVTDDTAHLAVLLLSARYVLHHKKPGETGILFVANSCEEGLGNLKGSRAVVAKYGSAMTGLVTLDHKGFASIVDQAVGSHRYRVTVKTEGGHSFGNFGNRNAIHCLSSMIDALYTVKVPEEPGSRTTYNVGEIRGGTSVNTIAQEAEMLYEYRSDSRICLAKMETMFRQVVEAYRCMGMDIQVERIGERPCSGAVDAAGQAALLQRVDRVFEKVVGKAPSRLSGSTDCNIPLSVGIPSVCFGSCCGGGVHTREEYLELDSLETGFRLALEFLLCD